MSEDGKSKPTLPGPNFVGDGPAAETIAELCLTLGDWMLSEDEGVSLLGSPPGEMSAWISQLVSKGVSFERHHISERDKGAVHRDAVREAFHLMVDTANKDEKQLLNLLGTLPPDAMQQAVESIQKGDKQSINETRSRIVERMCREFAKNVTPEKVAALGALVGRVRASRAASLCMVLYKTNLVCLIADARAGNQEAVLKLIKIDKLFLTDSCTSQAIRQAGLKIDRAFLKRLAKALAYKPKMRWRQTCKLYMYMILSSGLPLPSSVKLQLRIDPDGGRFKTYEAFEKFVERCRKEFKVLDHAAASISAPFQEI
ncbi:MAG: hypothetical protein ACRD28_05625 [Acidobacteriaceae bacterium]